MQFLNCTLVGNNGSTSLIRNRSTVGVPFHIFTNNIFTSNSFTTELINYNASWQTSGTITILTNLFDGAVTAPLQVNGSPVIGVSGNIAGNPDFFDLLGGDYRITTSSIAIDAGSSLNDVVEDFSGGPRPIGAFYDIGAFEGFSTSTLPMATFNFSTEAKNWNFYLE